MDVIISHATVHCTVTPMYVHIVTARATHTHTKKVTCTDNYTWDSYLLW